MKITQMSKEDFEKVPFYRPSMFNIYFRSLVIMPTGELHSSGFGNMEYCLVDDNEEPIIRVAGSSDVLCLDGIGGYGYWNGRNGVPKSVKPKGWSIDCLPCGYLRIFCSGKMFFNSYDIFGSTVEVYAGDEKIDKDDVK